MLSLYWWNMINLPEATPLKKNPSQTNQQNHSFRQQLSIAPQLMVGACKTLPTPCWKVDWLDCVQVLYRQPQLWCVHKCHGPVTFSELWLSRSFHPLFLYTPWVLGRSTVIHMWSRCDTFIAEPSADTFSLHSDQLWVSMLTTTHCTKKVSDDVWELQSVDTDKNFKGSLIWCSFNNITVVGSPLSLWAPQSWLLAINFWWVIKSHGNSLWCFGVSRMLLTKEVSHTWHWALNLANCGF